jgi:DNA polymerase elongation subunit (family B)
MAGAAFHRVTGWILDVYMEGDKAALWVKSEEGETFQLTDGYEVDLYVGLESRGSRGGEELACLIQAHPHVTRVEWEVKRIPPSMEEREILHVYVDSIRNYRRVLSDLKRLDGIDSYYNIDLLHVQKYLFRRGLPPTCKAELSYTRDGGISSLTILGDGGEVKPPPFKILIFDFYPIAVPRRRGGGGRISGISILDEGEGDPELLKGSEGEVVAAFQEHIQRSDPDLLVSEDVEEKVSHLLWRAREIGFNLQLGRTPGTLKPGRPISHLHRGRVLLDLKAFLRLGLAGIVERCRFAYIPPGLAAKWPAGRLIDSRQCYEALRRDMPIPRMHSFHYVKTVREAILSDRGGLILSPKIGLHENVAVLDFESMYPHIIVKHNISYETMSPSPSNQSVEGLIPGLTRETLIRRLYFKHLREEYPRGSLEYEWCDQRQRALKELLVCIYGYTGCFANRFSNISCYEEVNRIARENLVKAMNIAVEEGYEVIYADSDSIFVKKRGATGDEYKRLAEAISERLGLPMALEGHYKFMALLSRGANPRLGAARRYYGVLTDGRLHYRGIELRRHDTPPFIKDLQVRLMEILLDAESIEEIQGSRYREACRYVEEACNRVRRGEIPVEELAVAKALRKPVKDYDGLFPHVVAALQILQKRGKPRIGEAVKYIYVNEDHRNPYRRVVSVDVMDRSRRYYDKEKYVELVLDAAETILGILGFRRGAPTLSLQGSENLISSLSNYSNNGGSLNMDSAV